MSPLENALQTIIRVADPDKVILFGSQAKGEGAIGSDYDFLVLKKGLMHQRKITQEIYLNFKNVGAPVDVVVADMDKYERLKDNPYLIYCEIAKTGKAVYEKS